MEFKFNALAGVPQDDKAERDMFAADMAAEQASRGEPMALDESQANSSAQSTAMLREHEMAVRNNPESTDDEKSYAKEMRKNAELSQEFVAPEAATPAVAEGQQPLADIPEVPASADAPTIAVAGDGDAAAELSVDAAPETTENLSEEDAELLAELEKRLALADWFHADSDDRSVRQKGGESMEKLMADLIAAASRHPAQIERMWRTTPPLVQEYSGASIMAAIRGTAAAPAEVAAVDVPVKTSGSKSGKSDFAALLNLSAGKIGAGDVKISPIDNGQASMSSFSSTTATLDPVSEHEADELAAMLKREVENAHSGSPADIGGSGAPGAASPTVTAPTMLAAQSTPQLIGSAVGRAIGGAVATPFIALSSAAKHLSQRFGTPKSVIPRAPGGVANSLIASTGRAAAMVNTLETITQWKRDRIEKVAVEASKAASALTATEEFVVWEDSARTIAGQLNRDVADVVAHMHEEDALSSLKDGMDALWRAHPEKVAAYRKASDDFVRNINTVVKEFPNSDDDTKERVAKAMKSVEESTQMLPGFGQDLGEYQRTLAERVREMARNIEAFIRSLAAKLAGRPLTNSELTT